LDAFAAAAVDVLIVDVVVLDPVVVVLLVASDPYPEDLLLSGAL
jgi:hypothetical protein